MSDLTPTEAVPLSAVTHIAGLHMTARGKFLRQRCAWCGEILVDYDLSRVAGILGPNGAPMGAPPVFEMTRLVRVDGPQYTVLPPSGQLPPDFCGWLETAEPEHITGEVTPDADNP